MKAKTVATDVAAADADVATFPSILQIWMVLFGFCFVSLRFVLRLLPFTLLFCTFCAMRAFKCFTSPSCYVVGSFLSFSHSDPEYFSMNFSGDLVEKVGKVTTSKRRSTSRRIRTRATEKCSSLFAPKCTLFSVQSTWTFEHCEQKKYMIIIIIIVIPHPHSPEIEHWSFIL